jgi:drug/metabolite transporter (DMT)-like permease
MSRRHALMLALLALIWASSFMFIKVAVRELAPATLIAGRIALAALVLTLVASASLGAARTTSELRRFAGPLVVVGLLNTAVPFWLLSWGETRIDSGLAAIIQAALPIFMAAIAFGFFPSERVSGLRLVGVLVGFLGVALLVGAQPEGQILGALAVVGMATFYAIGTLLAGRYLSDTPPVVVALGTCWVAAIAVLGPGIAQAPHRLPGGKVIASVVVLGIVCTALAYLLFFAIVSGAGAARAGLVTYLVPPVALVYGAVFLDESIGRAALLGLALILGGVALGSRARVQREAVVRV